MTIRRLLLSAAVLAGAGCTSGLGGSGEPEFSSGSAVDAPVAESQEPSGGSEDPEVRAALTRAQVRWGEAGISDYRIVATESRNYWTAGCRWITVVRDGEVTEASVDPSSTSQYCGDTQWTVEQLHSRIALMAGEVDRFSGPEFGQHTLDVDFDENGVPTRTEYDLANGNDEESSFRVVFQALP